MPCAIFIIIHLLGYWYFTDFVNRNILSLNRFFHVFLFVFLFSFTDYGESNSLEFIRFGHLQLVRKRDGKVVDLTAPAFFWMRKDEEYCFAADEQDLQSKNIEHIYFDFVGERSERILKALDKLYPAGMFHPRDPEAVCDIFFRILHLYRIDRKEKLPEIGMLIEKLLFLAYDSAQAGIPERRDSYGLEKIAEKIRSEPFRDYDFHKLAAELNLSMDHFRRLFREKNQLPLQKYLQHQRMIRAAELLEKTNMRIKEIVFSCKFSNTMDFSRSFKRYSGLSPREYRRNRRRDGTSADR